jgi:hypothetical protein
MQGACTAAEARAAELNARLEELFAEEEMAEKEQQLAQVCGIGGCCAAVPEPTDSYSWLATCMLQERVCIPLSACLCCMLELYELRIAPSSVLLLQLD